MQDHTIRESGIKHKGSNTTITVFESRVVLYTILYLHEQALEQQMAELEHEEPEEGFGMFQQM